MSRSKKWRLEWAFFLGENGRRQYNKTCLGCAHGCKQSFRVALILYCIFKSACMKNGELDYVWLWILCGLPFGLHRMCLWIVPGGGSLGGGIALFALNFILGGVIGGFILAWRLIVAVWYVPLTVYRLIVG